MSKYHNRFYPHHFQSIINSILFFCLPVCFPENKNIKMYRTINLPVVLCGCETWSLTLRKEHRLRVLKSRVLRKIFGPKRDEITGEWRKLHNVELRDQYCSPYIIGVNNSIIMGWAGHVARMGESVVCRYLTKISSVK